MRTRLRAVRSPLTHGRRFGRLDPQREHVLWGYLPLASNEGDPTLRIRLS